MDNYRTKEEADRLMGRDQNNEIAHLRQQVATLTEQRDELQKQADAWLAENAPGGWIDVMQYQNQQLLWAIERMYEWANDWDSEFMNDPDWKNDDYPTIQGIVAAVKESK